jgi:arylsulfatase
VSGVCITGPALRLFTLALGLTTVLTGLVGACASDPEPWKRDRPNILVVVADDLGYSDIGEFGGEIATPNLDELARSGLRAASFYVSPRGEPTRAMLLTGVDHHLAGIGAPTGRTAPNQQGKPGYEGHLNDDVVTVATLLRDAGYHTYMAGKWELGHAPEHRPAARGFERSFALLDSVASYWDDMRSVEPGRAHARYSRDGELIESLPAGYYSTRSLTDEMIGMIDQGRPSGRPFFAYLAYQAPHGPLSVPDDWRDRYAGRYDDGFEARRTQRLRRMKGQGLVRHEVLPFPGLPTIPAWSELSKEQQRRQARKMELYAAMVENLDHHLGRLIEHLEAIGERNETLILFLSDNGAAADDRGPAGIDLSLRGWLAVQFPEAQIESWGRQGSYVEYGAAWAQIGMVPFRLFKGTLGEGGIRSPLIASGRGVAPGRQTQALLHVTDLAPTILEVAKVERPSSYRGRGLAALEGRSLVDLLAGNASDVRSGEDWVGFELDGQQALRQGVWKVVRMNKPIGSGKWRLYRLDRDPSELYDRAETSSDRRDRLVALWEEYARTRNVILPDRSLDPLDAG